MTPAYTDYLGRRIRVGAVVVYAVLGRIGDRQPLRRGVVLGFEDHDAWIRMLPDSVRGRRPATVRIPPFRVLVMPTALTRRQAAQLRAHVVRSVADAKRAGAAAGAVLGATASTDRRANDPRANTRRGRHR